MSSNNPNPYDDFFKDEKNKPSEEFLEKDRGQPELKVENSPSLNNRNIIIGGVFIVIVIVVIGIFGFTLAKRLGGNDTFIEAEIDSALNRIEYQDVGNLQNKISAENAKKLAIQSAARERLANEAAERLAREAAERKAREEAERLAREEAERLAREGQNKLGRLGGSGSTENPKATMQDVRTQKPEELSPEDRALLRKGVAGLLGYDSPVKHTTQAAASETTRPTTLGNMLITERHANGTAYLRPSREFLLMRGTNIPCTLLPRVVTNYASQPTCMVNEDIYSPEGIVLIERGSKVLGEQRIAMKAGVSKIFIAWADIETNSGVRVNIDSMGADALGGSGIDAWIDNHYMQRFGGAIMLSFIDDFAEIASSKIAKADYNFEQSTDNASSMSQIVLENSINIEPTGYIMPATQTTIIVARDVDFTHIYKVD